MADNEQTEFPFDDEEPTQQPDEDKPDDDQSEGQEPVVIPESQDGVGGIQLPDPDAQNNDDENDSDHPDDTMWSVYDTADGRRYEQTAEQIVIELQKRGASDVFHGEGDYTTSDNAVIQVRRAGRVDSASGPQTKAPIDDEQCDSDSPTDTDDSSDDNFPE